MLSPHTFHLYTRRNNKYTVTMPSRIRTITANDEKNEDVEIQPMSASPSKDNHAVPDASKPSGNLSSPSVGRFGVVNRLAMLFPCVSRRILRRTCTTELGMPQLAGTHSDPIPS